MSLRENITAELKRSPITVVATVIGVIIAGLALLVAWFQYVGQTPLPAHSGSGVAAQTAILNLTNLFIALSFFFASTLSAASLIRLMARLHDFAALVLSLPAAVLTGFSSLVVLHLAPPKTMNATALVAAEDSVLYGTIIIFVAINGLPVLRDIFSLDPRRKAEPNEVKKDSSTGSLIFAALLLIIWSALVSSGLSKLVKIFLTP